MNPLRALAAAAVLAAAVLCVAPLRRLSAGGPRAPDAAPPAHPSRVLDHAAGFVVLASVTEQLGKAAFHLNDAFELCMRYNRTCVLPTIQRGQMALEGFELFGDLYDVGALPPALSWATWGAFVGHLRGARVDVAECALGRERVGARERAAARRVVRFHAGAATFSVPEGCNLPMSTFAANASARTANLAALDAALARAPADVVLLHHQDFFQPIPLARAAGHALRIAPAVFERAAALRREIGPYIVLQWRTETEPANPVDFPRCARCAVEGVLRLRREAAGNDSAPLAVYFSADVDLDGLSWSNSVAYGNSSTVQEALQLIAHALPEMKSWRDVPAPRGTVFDLAAIGVLDRAVAMAADFFVSGPPACARGGTYVAAIDKWRWGQLQLAAAARLPEGRHVRNRNDQWGCEL